MDMAALGERIRLERLRRKLSPESRRRWELIRDGRAIARDIALAGRLASLVDTSEDLQRLALERRSEPSWVLSRMEEQWELSLFTLSMCLLRKNRRATNSLFFEADKRSLMGKCSASPER
jgi:hypothetical protein